ncbi:ATP-binding protein [Sphingomonas jatrophae]|nr:ATP-binding protein [Sphingomonas jatrophae]
MRAYRRLSILWQTLLLLMAALLLSQAISITLFLSMKPPRADFNRLSDIADALAGVRDKDPRDRVLTWRRQSAAPAPEPGMRGDPRFTAKLAERLGTTPARVRLFFEPDQRGGFPYNGRLENGVPMRRGEPMFFNRMIAGVAAPDGWHVVETPKRPIVSAWQRRSLLWFLVSALALVPLAWAFARALSRPIRRFADAADRLGADPAAPRAPEEGSAEIVRAGQALNAMQARLAAYLDERTAMIGAIAHDLRTPLARIAFRIEAAPDPLRAKVQADVEQMRAMIAATIGFVKGLHTGAREPVALDALLRRIAHDEAEIGRPVRLEEIEPATIPGDPLALERLVQNLVDNAVTYGGEAALSLRVQDGTTLLRVADRGPGVPADAVERMFAPFQRGDPSRNRDTGGIGLGLTIARAIAQDHGATLSLLNQPSGGLVAELRFGR